MTDKIVVFSSCGDEVEGRKLAERLVHDRLAACVSIIPHISSCYRWRGELETADECLLVIKSSRTLFDALSLALSAEHTYETPEILAVPVLEGSPAYLAWMDANLRSEGPE